MREQRWGNAASMMRWIVLAAALAVGGVVGVGGCANHAAEKQGSDAGGAGGQARIAAEGTLKVLFHIRAQGGEGSNELLGDIWEAGRFCDNHTTAQVVVIVDDSAFAKSSHLNKLVSELCASGARVEVPSLYQPPNSPKLGFPPCVHETKDIYARIAELVSEGWTYIAL